MDLEVIAWTTVFFGGDILILVVLLVKAMQADKSKARGEGEEGEEQGA